MLSRFVLVVFSIANNWSKERNPARINSKKFEHQSFITLSYWTDGYHWVKLNKEVISAPNGNTTKYYLSATEETTTTERNKTVQSLEV